MSPLDKPCPRCKAEAGQKCRNYLGKGCAPHRERGGKANKAFQQSANRKNAKVMKQAPLFAHLEPQATAEGERRRWMRNKAKAAEHGDYIDGMHLLDELRVTQLVRRVARGLVGDEAFEKLDAHCKQVYHATEYWYNYWLRVLTGERIEFGYRKVENRQPGQPAVVCTEWYERRHMSRDEYYRLFPYGNPKPPDSGYEAEGEAILARLTGSPRPS
jgi:hypothetical protein